MADSRREAIMKQIAAVLAATAGVDGRVFRSYAEAMDRDEHPCVLVRWTSEQADPQTVPQTERRLRVEVDIMVRGDVPDQLADPIAQSVHALIMADSSLGGRAIDVMFDGASFEIASADQTAGKITHTYEVMYRHSYADMAA
jgi:hypothetical protein